jgi:hypothetical protein
LIFAYLLAGLGLLFGVGSAAQQEFERQAATEIRTKLSGPQAAVQVRTRAVGIHAAEGRLKRVTIFAQHFSTPGLPLFTQPELGKSGRVDELVIHLDDFLLRGLKIKTLRASIPDCRYDFGLAVRKKMIRLSQSGNGTGEVMIQDADLEPFILAKYHEIKQVQVRVQHGLVHVSGYGEFLIISTHFEVVASLESRGGTQLVLSNAQITFDGKPADPLSQKALLDTLNPVVDLNRDLSLYDAIHVRSVLLENGVITAKGDTRIPVQPRG